MPDATTFLAGFVLALVLGGAVAGFVWLRQRTGQAEEASRVAVAEATKPLADTLTRIEGQIREIEAQRQHAMGGIDAQLAALGKDTVALAQALRGPNSRGRWGELTLRRVAELAGMVAQCDFFEQVQNADGRRPDMIVRLPGNRTLAVDAKAPLSGYLEAEAAPNAAGAFGRARPACAAVVAACERSFDARILGAVRGRSRDGDFVFAGRAFSECGAGA